MTTTKTPANHTYAAYADAHAAAWDAVRAFQEGEHRLARAEWDGDTAVIEEARAALAALNVARRAAAKEARAAYAAWR